MECSVEETPHLIYKTGNIFETDCECIVIPVNTVGVMGKGLALQTKQQNPHLFSVYKEACESNLFIPGRIMFYKSKENKDSKIFCLFSTKAHWKSSSKVRYIESGLQSFCEHYEKWNLESVAFPKLGCGAGGLNWEFHVKPLMEKYLTDIPIRIEIYE